MSSSDVTVTVDLLYPELVVREMLNLFTALNILLKNKVCFMSWKHSFCIVLVPFLKRVCPVFRFHFRSVGKSKTVPSSVEDENNLWEKTLVL